MVFFSQQVKVVVPLSYGFHFANRKSGGILIYFLLCAVGLFPLTDFNTFYLSLIFRNLIMTCLNRCSLWLSSLGSVDLCRSMGLHFKSCLDKFSHSSHLFFCNPITSLFLELLSYYYFKLLDIVTHVTESFFFFSSFSLHGCLNIFNC